MATIFGIFAMPSFEEILSLIKLLVQDVYERNGIVMTKIAPILAIFYQIGSVGCLLLLHRYEQFEHVLLIQRHAQHQPSM